MAKNKAQLVLLHGLFGSPLGLEEITADLQRAGYEVFTPAVPPFAGSESSWNKNSGNLSSLSKTTHGSIDLNKKYAEYFREYFAANHIKSPILIGHSMGTLVASSIIQYYPDLLNDKIILMSPISQAPPFLIGKVSVLSAYLPPKMTDWFTTNFLISRDGRKSFRQILRLVNQCSLDQRPQKNYIREATEFSARNTVFDLLSQTVPTKKHFQLYLLAGERDRLISIQSTIEIAERLARLPNNIFQCQTNFLPQTGHLHNYEKPHETARSIIEFLE